jgi:hypothetical protein
MSLHLSVISIEGNRLGGLPEVLKKNGYIIDQETTVETSEEAIRAAEEHPDRMHVTKVAYAADGFTHLLDLEMVLQKDDVWLEFTKRWRCRMVAWICEGAASSFALSVCDRGHWIRSVLAVEGEVRENEGDQLAEEECLEWSDANEVDVLAVIERLGASSDFSVDRQYRVYRLDESRM